MVTEFATFTSLIDKLLAVPRDVLVKRLNEHRKRSASNPNRRGPKRKVKSVAAGSASPDQT